MIDHPWSVVLQLPPLFWSICHPSAAVTCEAVCMSIGHLKSIGVSGALQSSAKKSISCFSCQGKSESVWSIPGWLALSDSTLATKASHNVTWDSSIFFCLHCDIPHWELNTAFIEYSQQSHSTGNYKAFTVQFYKYFTFSIDFFWCSHCFV